MRILLIVVGIALALAVYFVFIVRWMPEDAEWFDKTGLSPQIERELPRYMRGQLRQYWFSENVIKASDLQYMGVFPDGDVKTYFWKLPWEYQEVYLQLRMAPDSYSMSWNETKPPH